MTEDGIVAVSWISLENNGSITRSFNPSAFAGYVSPSAVWIANRYAGIVMEPVPVFFML
ncbi:hypothetical protein D3C71_2233490 [compost metagenome]